MNLWTDIRDFLFPRLCLSCGKKLLQSEDGLYPLAELSQCILDSSNGSIINVI